MSFSYAGPQTGPVGQVRFAIGDTVQNRAVLSDEEIAWLLAQADDNVAEAAIAAVQAGISRLAGLVDQTVGGVSKSYSQMQGAWAKSLAMLKSRDASAGGMPLAGGIYRSGQQMRRRDTSLARPLFYRGQFGGEGRGYSTPAQPCLGEPDSD